MPSLVTTYRGYRTFISYGKPGTCQECMRLAAFDKGLEAQQKVGGQLLCFLCTRNYKRKVRARNEKSSEAPKKRDRSDGDAQSGTPISKRSHMSSKDYASTPVNSISTSSLTPEPNWKVLYEEKEAQAQAQVQEYLTRYKSRLCYIE